MTVLFAGLFLSACAFAPRVSAIPTPLPPGGNVPASPVLIPVGGTILDSTTATFSSVSLNGTVVSTVYQGDPSSSLGGLTFTYLLKLNLSSPDELSQMALGSFDTFLTDVSFDPSNGGVAPSNFTRDPFGTIGVHWDLNPQGGLLPGQTGALIVIQTDATSFQVSNGGVIDTTPANLDGILAPIAVPAPVPDETGTVALFAASLGVLVVFRRCQSKPALAAI